MIRPGPKLLARIAVVWFALALGALPAQAQDDAIPRGIVSISVTSQAYDELLPWIKQAEQTLRGNAIVVKGQRLLTTADMVKNATLLEVRKFGRYPDYAARPVLVDYDLNLALLEVPDPAFWQGLKPLPLAERPLVSGHFAINRWRSNGRLEQGTGEVVEYLVSNSPFGVMEFPVMRGTTAMAGLGWSEVMTHDGAVIGLLTSHRDQEIQATNSDLMRLLVAAAARGSDAGFAHRGFAWQRLNQSDLRAYYGQRDQESGVMVRRVLPEGTGAGQLQSQDILHRINGYTVDPEGRIDHPTYGLLAFTVAINESLQPTVGVEIERKGKRMHLDLKRRRFTDQAFRIPPPQFGAPNPYEVIGGIVLQELSVGYLRAWGGDWRDKAPPRLVLEYVMHSLRDADDPPERVVLISRVLPDPANLGYEDVSNAIVTAVNGQPVHSLEDVRAGIAKPAAAFHEIDLLPGAGRTKLIFDVSEMAVVNRRVQSRYGIPASIPAR